MTDATEREALRIALQSAIRDRDRAEATISFLTEKLGLTPAGDAVLLNPGEGTDTGSELRDVGPVHVGDSEYYGLSQTKAAAAFLDRAGRSRPQRTDQIIAALAKGGVRIGGKDPEGTFYKILNRNPTFHRVGPSLWGLASWYPNAPKRGQKGPLAPVETDSETPEATGETEAETGGEETAEE